MLKDLNVSGIRNALKTEGYIFWDQNLRQKTFTLRNSHKFPLYIDS